MDRWKVMWTQPAKRINPVDFQRMRKECSGSLITLKEVLTENKNQLNSLTILFNHEDRPIGHQLGSQERQLWY